MDSKRTGPNPKPTQPPPKGARVTNANYADIVKGLSKGDKPVVQRKTSSDENIFFITAKDASTTNAISSKSKESTQGIGITEKEFLHLIQDLEDQNLFILKNIEQTEAELEQFNLKSVDKYENEEKMIA